MVISHKFLRRVIAAFLLGLATGALAQNYPAKAVRVIVPFPPGGTTDVVGRIITAVLSKDFGRQFVIDNRGGAGGSIGADLAAKSVPDGYTLLLFHLGMVFGPALYDSLPYDVVKDFAPISLVGSAPSVLIVNSSLPVRSLREFIALAKAKPGQLNYGTAGTGSSGHLAVELFQDLAHVKFTHVPYKGGGPAVAATISGEVAFMIETAGSVVPQIKAGRLRALGVTSANRLSALTDVPPIAEGGLPNYVYTTWYGIWAPAKAPVEVVNRLNQAIQKALAQSEVRASLQNAGIEPESNTPVQFGDLVRSDLDKWTRIIRSAGIKGQ